MLKDEVCRFEGSLIVEEIVEEDGGMIDGTQANVIFVDEDLKQEDPVL